ncbi:MAG: DUF2934 domain-containing protein [Chitinispirillaceae bacterium]|nr:DUF2934 domain-containing protein [Chitinispirillaceae bacterium]
MDKKNNKKTPNPGAKKTKTIAPEQLIAEINKRAFYLSLERGNNRPGAPLEDWLTAEKEIKARHGIA